jgi:hypothetical protein
LVDKPMVSRLCTAANPGVMPPAVLAGNPRIQVGSRPGSRVGHGGGGAGEKCSLLTSYGLFDRAFKPNSFASIDPPQIYADLHLPILTDLGLDIRGGRFYDPAGYESVKAVKRPLLSAP